MGKRRTFIFDGLGVSSGVAIGPAFVLEPHGQKVESHHLAPEETALEVERFLRAVENAKKEVQEIGRAVAERLDSQQAAIFDAHVTLLGDPLLIERTLRGIREDYRNAEFVFWTVTQEIGQQLQNLGDLYFSERSHDLYDVARRVLKFLSQDKNPTSQEIPAGSIIVAPDLGPSETALLHRDRIAAFATDSGGPTSHTAIMAKALSLPAVVGLDFITHYARTGDTIIIDGSSGKIVLHPTPEQISYYEDRVIEYRQARANLGELRDLPAETLDGVRVNLEANLEFVTEIPMVLSQGAEGIGLFRTEYFFIERRSLPSEEEQEEAYAKVLETMGERPVVFRTLDVGGDKLAGSIPTPSEANPFLGLRAIRLCLAHPDLFRRQLRPMMRAAAGRRLNILLPMISCIDEVRAAREFIDECYNQLVEYGGGVPSCIKLGAMIEIPSAAIQIDTIASEVDFLSIGTNDLIQYTLAVDRVNKLVGHLYTETHPAVLWLISRVVEAGKRLNKPVTVCGEMAGDPLMALLLVGLGIRCLSMSPGLIGPVKKMIRGSELGALEQMASQLLTMDSPQAARAELMRQVEAMQRTASPR